MNKEAPFEPALLTGGMWRVKPSPDPQEDSSNKTLYLSGFWMSLPCSHQHISDTYFFCYWNERSPLKYNLYEKYSYSPKPLRIPIVAPLTLQHFQVISEYYTHKF